MYKKILIATDGSDQAESAVEHGLHLAKSLGAKVVFVTVTEPWSPLDVAAEAEQGNFDAIQVYEEAMALSAKAILKRAEQLAASISVGAEALHVKDRQPAEGILEIAELENCELIIMASHGRRGIQKMLLGSQASEVISLSTRPVLVVR